MVIIETPGCTVRVDGDAVDRDEVLKLWTTVHGRLRSEAQIDRLSPSRLDGGSVTGFVVEQADESLNDRLPGGGAI